MHSDESHLAQSLLGPPKHCRDSVWYSARVPYTVWVNDTN